MKKAPLHSLVLQDTKLYIRIQCTALSQDVKVKIGWIIREAQVTRGEDKYRTAAVQ